MGVVEFQNMSWKAASTEEVLLVNESLHLNPGAYLFQFHEKVATPNDLRGEIYVRSSLFRSGISIHAGLICGLQRLRWCSYLNNICPNLRAGTAADFESARHSVASKHLMSKLLIDTRLVQLVFHESTLCFGSRLTFRLPFTRAFIKDAQTI
jgi:hypothetical protein